MARNLREDEHARARGLAAHEQPVEKRQLATRLDEALAAQPAQLGLSRTRRSRQVVAVHRRQLDELGSGGSGMLRERGGAVPVDGEHNRLG
eukprot:2789240-Prymnesium_polylepis.1